MRIFLRIRILTLILPLNVMRILFFRCKNLLWSSCEMTFVFIDVLTSHDEKIKHYMVV